MRIIEHHRDVPRCFNCLNRITVSLERKHKWNCSTCNYSNVSHTNNMKKNSLVAKRILDVERRIYKLQSLLWKLEDKRDKPVAVDISRLLENLPPVDPDVMAFVKRQPKYLLDNCG